MGLRKALINRAMSNDFNTLAKFIFSIEDRCRSDLQLQGGNEQCNAMQACRDTLNCRFLSNLINET